MPEQTLFRLLHISDLHLSDRVDAKYDARVTSLLALSSRFEGLLGHHYDALTQLADFWKALLKEDASCKLAVSGDLTVNGAVAQFDLAQNYLGATCFPAEFSVGLQHPGWNKWSVPGNHDHWPGTNAIFGGPTAGLDTCFPHKFPFVGAPYPLANGTKLRFIFINTDADVGPYSGHRFFARGGFVSQLQTLQSLLKPAAGDEARVLVLHHSMMPTTPHGPGRRSLSLIIEPHTRKVLEHFLVDFGIKVLLCGHMHVPRLSEIVVSNNVQQSTVLEARCGTSTQRDKFPYDVLRKLSPKRAPLPPNTLIVHRIVARGGLTIWKSQIYWRANSGYFVDSTSYVSPLLPPQLNREIQLLP